MVFQDVNQIQIGLSRPSEDKCSDLLDALQMRLTESTQKEFLRKERRKVIF